jgi:hypothetical protein
MCEPSVRKGDGMNIGYVHASKFGNGAAVAEVFRDAMADRGIPVRVDHLGDVEPRALPVADLYVFSSPGRFGRPIRSVRRFLKEVRLPEGTRYAILTTEMMPKADRDGSDAEGGSCGQQRVRPIMRELLQEKGLVEVAEGVVHVTGMKGPLEDTWREKVAAFAARIPIEERAGR